MSNNSVTITDLTGRMISANRSIMDRVLNNVAVDIARLSKEQVPFEHGALRASQKVKRKGLMNYEVSYNTPYAHRWEYETPPHGFKTQGTKSHYLKDPADKVSALVNVTKLMQEEIARIAL